MSTAIDPSVDEPHHDTWFCKALRWQVHNADDAMDLVSSHRAQAAKARAHIPAATDCFHSKQTAALWEGRACNHDEIAAVCERHAARLRAATPYQTVTLKLTRFDGVVVGFGSYGCASAISVAAAATAAVAAAS